MAQTSFLKQFSGAALVMGALIGGLTYLGRQHATPAGEAVVAPPPRAPAFPETGPATELSLIPARAWLVIEFDGGLVNARPFGGDGAPCENVPSPERVVFAAVPGPRTGDELSFWLGSSEVDEAFFACASKKILASGGRESAGPMGTSVVQSQTGILVHAGKRLLFSTDATGLDEVARLLHGRAASAQTQGPHGAALATLKRAAPVALALSLELPSDWLTGVDPSYARSPLVALHGATFSITNDSGARGVLRCEPTGCPALHAFSQRALGDLLAQIPESLRPRFEDAVRVIGPTSQRPGELRVEVSPAGVELGRYLLGSWGQANPIP